MEVWLKLGCLKMQLSPNGKKQQVMEGTSIHINPQIHHKPHCPKPEVEEVLQSLFAIWVSPKKISSG